MIGTPPYDGNPILAMTDHFQDETVMRITSVEDADAYHDFAARNSAGISIIPNHDGHLEAEVSDFVKWVRADHAHIPIIYPQQAPKLVLHGADIWLPLIFLAGDTSVQIFLNMLASYLYDKAKGALKKDNPTVHVSVNSSSNKGVLIANGSSASSKKADTKEIVSTPPSRIGATYILKPLLTFAAKMASLDTFTIKRIF